MSAAAAYSIATPGLATQPRPVDPGHLTCERTTADGRDTRLFETTISPLSGRSDQAIAGRGERQSENQRGLHVDLLALRGHWPTVWTQSRRAPGAVRRHPSARARSSTMSEADTHPAIANHFFHISAHPTSRIGGVTSSTSAGSLAGTRACCRRYAWPCVISIRLARVRRFTDNFAKR